MHQILFQLTQTNKSIHLYNNAKIVYESMEITSGIIVIDYGNNEIYAGRIKDSLGNYTQSPVFKTRTRCN